MKILYAVNNSLRGGEKGSGRDRYCILCSLSGAWTHYKSTSLAAFCVSALAYLLCISSERERERLHCVCLHAAALTGSDLKMLCSLVARQPPPPRRRLSARVYSHHIYTHHLITPRRLHHQITIYFNCFIHFWRVCHKQHFLQLSL